MEFEWDSRKSATNLRKHGIAFPQAVTVLENDENAITIFDEASTGEDRYLTLGNDALGRVLVVTYTTRGDRVRIISARRANNREREEYEGHLK